MTPKEPSLSSDQIERYWRDGFLYGMPILTSDQMSIARKKLANLEQTELENDAKRWIDPTYQPWMEKGSPWWHWFQGMVRHPTITRIATTILGPNVLVRNADIFIKPVNLEETIQWHSDTTAKDSDADKMMTAWIAISESTKENGCMEWLTGSHRRPLPPEVKDKFSLSYGPESIAAIQTDAKQANILKPGEMSIHHFRTVHRSLYNQTSTPRVGLVIRFMASDTPLEVAESGKGTLVAGSNVPGHFKIEENFHVSWRRSESPQMMEQAERLLIV